MMEVTQAVPPSVDFKDKIKTNGVLTPTKKVEKPDDTNKLTEKSDVLAKTKEISTTSTANGNSEDDIFTDDIDDPNLLNTNDVNGGDETDEIDFLAEEFLNEIGYEDDTKIEEDALLNEENEEDVVKKTEDALLNEDNEEDALTKTEDDCVEQKPESLENNTEKEKENENLPDENLDKEENNETEAQVETKTDENEEIADLDTVVSDQETILEISTRKSSVEGISQEDSPLAAVEDSSIQTQDNDTEKLENLKSDDLENQAGDESASPAKSEEHLEIKKEIPVDDKDTDKKDVEHLKASKPSDCDIINLDSPMAVEHKEENKIAKSSESGQDENEKSSALVEDIDLASNKRKRESRTSRGSRTSRESRDSRESKESKESKESREKTEKGDDKTEETQESVTPEPKRRKSSVMEDLKEDDILLEDDKLQVEGNIESLEEKETSEKENTNIVVQDKSNENESDDDDVVILEEENVETVISKKTDEEEHEKEVLKKSEDAMKEKEKEEEKGSSDIKVTEDKGNNDSDDDVVVLDDDVEESEAKNVTKGKEENIDVTSCKEKSAKEQESSDEKLKENQASNVDTNKKNVSDVEDDDDVVLLEVIDEKDTKIDKSKDVKEPSDKTPKEENKEKTTEIRTNKEVISGDSSTAPKTDKSDDKEDDDDEIVFMVEDKASAIGESKDQKDKVTSAPSTRSSSRKSSKDVDESESKPSAISPDNSDNAQDKFPDKAEENADGDNNLLEEGKPPEICSNDENSDLENSNEPLAKRLKSGDDEISQSSLTIETDTKTENVDRKSLKRSISTDSGLHDSKKLKAENNDAIDKKRGSDDLLIPRPPSTKPVDLNLDFLRRFKKSISKMTKTDLEELVLQKIVEAIVHKSEFSEMRDLIEKQEKIIATHRTKIAEITKQFRDLEMVHNRVVKDIETKNQQFIMPIKITRAVGLQVLIPKRADQNVGASKANTTSERTAPPPTLPNPTVSNTIETAKRKCAQKITPLRPDTAQSPMNRSFPPSIAQNGPNNTSVNSPQLSSAPSTPQATKPLQKILPRTTPTTPVTSQQTANMTQTTPTQYIIQQPSFTPVTSQAVQAVRKSTNSLRSANQATVQRPSAPQSSPDRPRVPPMILKKSGTNGQVLTVATPTNLTVSPVATSAVSTPSNKSFIDLTDEDDNRTQQTTNLPALVAIPAGAQPTTRVTYVVNKASNAPQRVTVTQNSTNMTRMPAVRTRAPYALAPKLAPVQQQQTVATQSSGPRMPATTTLRRTHPAPLPKSPPAISNPAWKSSPPRPAIRINNIDSGIVISWTMDEMTDQHAEVTSYQIYAYQETSAPPQVEAWRHVGDVKAMLLPMAVTLTQFQEGQRYYFAVRAVDIHSRCGPFSIPKTWS